MKTRMPPRRPDLPQSAPIPTESTTRQVILRAAGRVFLVKGYEGTSMELVAVESGAGRRTVYNHFKSKKALFDATVALLWEQMPLEKIVKAMGTARQPEQDLREIGNAIANFWAPDDAVAFMRMVICESSRFPKLAQSFFASGPGRPRRALTDYLRALSYTKVLRIPDPDLAAVQFISLINGMMLWNRLVGGGKAPSKAKQKYVVNEAVQTILCRYQAGKGR